MLVTDIVANPADMLGPTYTAAPFPNTIAVEDWSLELAEWLALRGLDVECEPGRRIVVRRDGWIHAVMPPVGPAEALEHVASRIQGTWQAAFVPAVTS